jgi:hypothetical protein
MKKTAPGTSANKHPAKGSKKAATIKLMQRAKGASLAEMMALTGWQKHTVRGFLSLLGSHDGLKIKSAMPAVRERKYRIARKP